MVAVARVVDEEQRASDGVRIRALRAMSPRRRALSIAFPAVSITPL